ncbi:jg9363 [Pararge aegeria aegeria]|uniref:Jg9363 protein n=1 Tax=Pararge aegeria aegeria TaxID=348720 RepID=A0A8S4S1F4_9NEOP|nr:jg9363 [Pararge aegeria aegeria]
MENLQYRVIYEYMFYRGTSAAEPVRRMDDFVCWTSAGVVHYSFLKSGQTITADALMMEKLASKQSWLVSRRRQLLLQDNARPQTAQQTATKLEKLQLSGVATEVPEKTCSGLGRWRSSLEDTCEVPPIPHPLLLATPDDLLILSSVNTHMHACSDGRTLYTSTRHYTAGHHSTVSIQYALFSWT